MDLLVEKGDSRTYLSRYKVITTLFEESSPSVKRNNTQIQYRNGNVDFGGWNEAKTIDYVGYYRADDLEDEEYLRERIYALLSDPDGYYITQLKNDSDNSYERPGENTGDYFEKQVNRPSHKRFYVYASSLESELVGSYGGHVLYKISATFTTMKLPYGESVPRDLDNKDNVPYYGDNFIDDSGFESGKIKDIAWGSAATGTVAVSNGGSTYPIPFGNYMLKIESDDNSTVLDQSIFYSLANAVVIKAGETWTYSYYYASAGSASGQASDYLLSGGNSNHIFALSMGHGNRITTGGQNTWHRFTATFTANADVTVTHLRFGFVKLGTNHGWLCIDNIKLEKNSSATPWSPSLKDSGYNKWYIDTHYSTDNLVIPYAGTVPCSQLEQGFVVEFTAKTSGENLKISLNGTDFIVPGNVVSGDVFKISGYEYTKNGTSIVKATNKAYFKLLPNVKNKISSSIPGAIRILNYQNLYA